MSQRERTIGSRCADQGAAEANRLDEWSIEPFRARAGDPVQDRLIRLVDILISLAGVILFWPLILALGLGTKLSSPGPMLFRQSRLGLGGRPFEFLKVRSMIAGADSAGPWSTAQGDDRIVPFGRFLRRTSLDELPQLLNVLRGHMSLVGPRPMVPEQAAEFEPAALALRHRVRPGITGLAQVMGRSQLRPEQTLYYDLDWATRHGIPRYFLILFRTTWIVLLSRGTN